MTSGPSRPRTFAVLPVKRFGAAKQRLTPALAPAQRRELAEAMVGDVLSALARVEPLLGVLVVSGEPAAEALAAATGATVVADAHDAGQSPATLLGIARARELGAERVLLVPGDCPALDPAEVESLLATGDAVVVVPDRHGSGTNALLLTPPDAIEPAFGPGSRERHEGLATAAGQEARIAEIPSLGLDVDSDGDLRALAATLRGRPGGAERTRAILDRVLAAGPGPA
jgi:2-phospho-L-lactate guanylyltransferase